MSKNGHGHSGYTSVKQRHLSTILNTHLKIVNSIIRKKVPMYPNWAESNYLYIDAYAGPGTLDGYYGSPLIFMEEAVSLKVNFHAHFIEKNESFYESLRNSVGSYPDVHIHLGDNVDILRDIGDLATKGRKQFGLLYADPNGVPCFDPIKGICGIPQFDKLDVLINCPATALKRAIAHPKCPHDKPLVCHLSETKKDFWIIREPYDRWQWTFLLGTNWDSFPEFSELGFHRLSSPEGRRLLEKLSYTSDEISYFKGNGYYPDYAGFISHPFTRLTIKEVMGKAKHRCQRCKVAWATDPHHLRYPKWEHKNDIDRGFDSLDDIVALCHKCHCEIEGKDR